MRGTGGKSESSRGAAELSRYKIEQLALTIRLLIIAGTVIAVGALLQQALVDIAVALAGKTTDANIVMTLLNRSQFGLSVSFLFGGGGVLYGYAQQKLRESTVKRLHQRIASMEKEVDPARTSSHLTSTGKTNPKDKR